MVVHGRDIQFLLTVRAADAIAKLCPDQDIAKVNEMLNHGDFTQKTEAARGFIAIMANGHDEHEAWNANPAEAQNLTADELLDVPVWQLFRLLNEAVDCFIRDRIGTVEVEPGKKTNAPE